MLLDDARCGDIAILSDGSQAIIHGINKTSTEKFIVDFDKEVAGWVGDTRYCWCYNRDGSFSISFVDRRNPHVDIVKVVHND